VETAGNLVSQWAVFSDKHRPGAEGLLGGLHPVQLSHGCSVFFLAGFVGVVPRPGGIRRTFGWPPVVSMVQQNDFFVLVLLRAVI
jgi:hypothetical protein